jgi:hypothetical protein
MTSAIGMVILLASEKANAPRREEWLESGEEARDALARRTRAARHFAM